jgi:hypothetical protein
VIPGGYVDVSVGSLLRCSKKPLYDTVNAQVVAS